MIRQKLAGQWDLFTKRTIFGLLSGTLIFEFKLEQSPLERSVFKLIRSSLPITRICVFEDAKRFFVRVCISVNIDRPVVHSGVCLHTDNQTLIQLHAKHVIL